MDKMLTKGERIWRSLLNPSSENIAASEWLLLFTVCKNNGICLKEISKKLSENWEKVHNKKPGFYIKWSTGYEIDKELIRYEDIGILKITKWTGEEPCWSLTGSGEKVLNDWKGNVRKMLGTIVDTL